MRTFSSRKREADTGLLQLEHANSALRLCAFVLKQATDVDAALIEAVRTEAEAGDATAGVLGSFIPEEQGVRNLFTVIEGKLVRTDDYDLQSSRYFLDEEPLGVAWNEVQHGNDALRCDSDTCSSTKDAQHFPLGQILLSSVLVPLMRASECIGYLGLLPRLIHTWQPVSEICCALSPTGSR